MKKQGEREDCLGAMAEDQVLGRGKKKERAVLQQQKKSEIGASAGDFFFFSSVKLLNTHFFHLGFVKRREE